MTEAPVEPMPMAVVRQAHADLTEVAQHPAHQTAEEGGLRHTQVVVVTAAGADVGQDDVDDAQRHNGGQAHDQAAALTLQRIGVALVQNTADKNVGAHQAHRQVAGQITGEHGRG